MNDNIHRRKDRTPDPFYRDKRWKRLRRAMLARAGWMCEECRRYGKREDAEAVHHVYPKNEYPEYQWTAWNLMCLSKTCHYAIHDAIPGMTGANCAEKVCESLRASNKWI